MLEGKGEIFIYESQNGQTSIEVSLEQGTVWLTQQQISILFGTQRPAITKHLNNIFKSRELEERSVPFWNILQRTAKVTKPDFTIWTPCFPSIKGLTTLLSLLTHN